MQIYSIINCVPYIYVDALVGFVSHNESSVQWSGIIKSSVLYFNTYDGKSHKRLSVQTLYTSGRTIQNSMSITSTGEHNTKFRHSKYKTRQWKISSVPEIFS
jgi:hypothetical protein